ncbi:alcohol dehydrogenase catalytic domain-containing protein [Candidatus Woesearchaeota archaeon]|nr:alcohol dehydrogenase catalytic domain-containing protein [Candidatus Woesearchaeota archaeon]
MRAAVLQGINDLKLGSVPVPQLKPGSLLLKIHACAICGSDIRILKSGNNRVKYPAIIGHESSGEVVMVGEGITNFRVGDRLALGADIPCGRCIYCTNGLGNCCDENYALGYKFPGAFAEYCLLEPIMVNYGPLIKIPDSVSYDEAALMEPLACVLNGFELAQMKVGKSVLIIGAGPIGCMGIMVAKALGASAVILAEVDEKRLEEAKQFGADIYINSRKDNLIEEVKKMTLGRGVDGVFTMCPSVEAHEQAIELVAKRGYVNLFGGLPIGSRKAQITSNLIHYKECFVMGSHGSTPRHNKLAMDLIATKKVDVGRLITHRFGLEEIKMGIKVMENLEGMKIIIKPGGIPTS